MEKQQNHVSFGCWNSNVECRRELSSFSGTQSFLSGGSYFISISSQTTAAQKWLHIFRDHVGKHICRLRPMRHLGWLWRFFWCSRWDDVQEYHFGYIDLVFFYDMVPDIQTWFHQILVAEIRNIVSFKNPKKINASQSTNRTWKVWKMHKIVIAA